MLQVYAKPSGRVNDSVIFLSREKRSETGCFVSQVWSILAKNQNETKMKMFE
ncbi:hypothetical protein [Candidatus Tisiphia endosymbiont of Hybos culiciformis]|uniref:hypothetical protein n=1 Tax=Candidatus Tisiphia endosymbiont of Hybos culiciformis TaxID=3139331 RepID=UPI003CCB4B2F